MTSAPKTHSANLVLVVDDDVFMPDMDGIEFLDHLSKQRYAGGVMLVSGQDVTMMAIAQEIALESGLKLLGAYTKPVPMAVVAAVLTRAAPLAP